MFACKRMPTGAATCAGMTSENHHLIGAARQANMYRDSGWWLEREIGSLAGFYLEVLLPVYRTYLSKSPLP